MTGHRPSRMFKSKDWVRAILPVPDSASRPVEVLKVRSQDQISVTKIARLITREMGEEDVEFEFTEAVDGRGWVGDVKSMLLDIDKIRSHGWTPWVQ